jgi:hypothetical protein
MELAKKLFPSKRADEPDRSNKTQEPQRIIRLKQSPITESDSADLRAEVEKRLTSDADLDHAQISEERKIQIIADVRTAITEGLTVDRAIFGNAWLRSAREKSRFTDRIAANFKITDRRCDVICDIYDDYEDIIGEWDENDNALTDAVMSEHFEREDCQVSVDDLGNSFLTTYFDGAQFGLQNKLLDAEAQKKAQDRKRFDIYTSDQLKTFIRFFTLSQSDRFTLVNSENVPINAIFEKN